MSKLEDSEFEALVGSELTDAISFVESDIAPLRAEATKRYFGREYGDETEGSSQVISHDVRDTVNQILPGLMRVFHGSDQIVEFVPNGPEDVKGAEQATDYANLIYNSDNDGFLNTLFTLKDAAIRKCGIQKAYWDVKTQVKVYRYTGLDDATLSILINEPDTSGEVTNTYTQMIEGIDPNTGLPAQIPVNYHDVKVTKTFKQGRVKIEVVPLDEIVVSRRDKYIGESFVAHRRLMTVSDLVAMGYDEDEIEEYITDSSIENDEEVLARRNITMFGNESSQNEAMRRVLYCECYIRADVDGDDVAELVKVCTIGPGYKVVMQEECEVIPFADFPFDPEPHVSSLEAISLADDLIDIQRLKTAIWRNSLDSLAQTINPRTGVVEGQVNIDDVLDNSVGGVIRMKSPTAVVPFATPDTSGQGLAMISYVDSVKEARTGMSAASMGLDADALQNTSRIAASATVQGGQAKQELIARVMANGFKKLFKLILHLVTTHQDQPRMIRLRNEWVPIDPRVWNADMDVQVNVGLGGGTAQDKLQVLSLVAQKQEMILQTAGINNPIVSLAQYSNTLSRMMELSGFKDSGSYFTKLPMDYKAPEQPETPDAQAQATALLAQVEREKTQAKMQADAANFELKKRQQEIDSQQAQFDAMMKIRQQQADAEAKAIKQQQDNDNQQAKLVLEAAQLKLDKAEAEAKIRLQQAELVLKDLQSSGKGGQTGNVEEPLARAIASLGTLIAATSQQNIQALNAPKEVVRDEMGRVVGVKPMETIQ